MKNNTVTLTRSEYNRTLPWSAEALALRAYAKRTDSLAGFVYTFRDTDTAVRFAKALGV